ncbi:MAG: signal recognition particle subunit SRP19/SEC65 family protein [Halobacteriota archaeon]
MSTVGGYSKMAKNSKRIIWPIYLDSHKTRKNGRVLAKKDSISAPGIDEIMQAAGELGLNPSCENEKMYPRSWWEYKGRVLIKLDGNKRDAMKQIAHKIKAIRAQHDS